MRKSTGFEFIIDTKDYAGSFERELTAFCTGQVGECGVGQTYAKKFFKEAPKDMADLFNGVVGLEPDEHGCCRPCLIVPTPGFWNDGLGNAYPDSVPVDDPAVLKAYRKEAAKHGMEKTLPSCNPSYQSVSILFTERLEEPVLQFLVERAQAYEGIEPWESTPTIIGFRFIETFEDEDTLWAITV